MKFCSRCPFSFVALSLALLLPPAVRTQVPAPAQAQRQTSTPYAGDLSIFEDPNRDRNLQIDRVMDILHITKGKAVADVGAGGGWFTVRAAKRVGPEGIAFGEDINAAAVKSMEQRAAKQHLPQMHAVLGTPDDPRLPEQVDAVLLLKVYHEIANPVPFMQHLHDSLKPGARIGIIDRNGNGADHGLQQNILEREMTQAGYRELEHYDFTKADGQDYFLVFVAK